VVVGTWYLVVGIWYLDYVAFVNHILYNAWSAVRIWVLRYARSLATTAVLI
jgi:hypothetical protein